MEQDNDKGRKRFSPEEKFKIIKEQITTKTSVSEICKKYAISTSNFYLWQEHFFAGAMAGFDKKRGPQASTTKSDQKVQELESDVTRLREVIIEITAENIAYKKKNSASPFHR